MTNRQSGDRDRAVPDFDQPDRPWQVAPLGRWDPELIRSWGRLTRDQESISTGTRPPTEGGEPCGEAGITVIIWAHGRAARIEPCLDSLAAQTLRPEFFEVIVVRPEPDEESRAVLEAFRARCPAVSLRVVWINQAGAAHAWNAGIAAARRAYTTFVDGTDSVSPAFLESLLAHAAPRVVAMATVAGADRATATTSGAGQAVATGLIKDLRYPVDLDGGADVVFWVTLTVTREVEFRQCPSADGAVYQRGTGTESGTRQVKTYESEVARPVKLISHLDRLVPAGRHRDLVIDHMQSQASRIGRYLADNPADHPAAVRELDRSGIAHLPYGLVNGSRARELIVAYQFPPYAGTSSLVMARRVRQRGEVVDVIYNRQDEARHRDETSRLISGPFVGREAALATPTSFSSWDSIEKFTRQGMRVISQWEEGKGRRYLRVYSRAHAAASHFLAAAYKLSNPSSTWTAEFSDPISRDIEGRLRGNRVPPWSRFAGGLAAQLRARGLPVPKIRRALVWCEEIAYALADQLVFINTNQREYMLDYCSDPRLAELALDKSVIAPHPTLPPEFYTMVKSAYSTDSDLLNIGYFGAFYPKRGLDDVLLAMASAAPGIRSRLRLHVFTTRPADLERRAREFGLSDAVVASPPVPYLEFLGLTVKLDCLVVSDAVTAGSHPTNPYLPSKLSDYRGSGRPIWGLVEDGSPLSRETLAYATRLGDVEGARSVLVNLVAQKFPAGRGEALHGGEV